MPNQDYLKYRRQSFRLQGYDYRNEGMYFVTICTKDRISYFGKVENGQMILSDMGKVVFDNWLKIPQFSPHIVLDEFVVMPNHIHGILAIVASVASLHCNDATDKDATAKNQFMSAISPKSGSISRVLNSYKGACSKEIKAASAVASASLQCNDATFSWQSKFHDRIIRNEEELHRIQQYIINNPKNWKKDESYLI
jgi:putative transposase